MEFNLILSTESKVLSTNIADFEKQANQYLSTLTSEFTTDDDFARAKDEVKELKDIETKIREAIKQTQNGEIAKLVETAENIAERFRQERLKRDKLVKEKETEIKNKITDEAIAEIIETRTKLAKESDISLALEITMPKASIVKRIEESQKNKRTIDGLTKSVNAEKTVIISEMSVEIARLSERLEQINAKSNWLFHDAVKLIATQDDLAPIIHQRIEAEQQREAKAKAEAEEKTKLQAEAKAITDAMDAQSAIGQQKETTSKPAALSQEADYIISIPFNGTKEQAITFAREIKAKYGDGVKLNVFKK